MSWLVALNFWKKALRLHDPVVSNDAMPVALVLLQLATMLYRCTGVPAVCNDVMPAAWYCCSLQRSDVGCTKDHAICNDPMLAAPKILQFATIRCWLHQSCCSLQRSDVGCTKDPAICNDPDVGCTKDPAICNDPEERLAGMLPAFFVI